MYCQGMTSVIFMSERLIFNCVGNMISWREGLNMEKCWKCKGYKIIPSMGGMTIKCTECGGVGYIDKPPTLSVKKEFSEQDAIKSAQHLKRKVQSNKFKYIPLDEGESETEG
jgi:rRNA maturation protein Nop10